MNCNSSCKEQDILSKVNKKIISLIKSGILNKGDILEIKISNRNNKKLMAILNNGEIVHFGSKTSITHLEEKNENKRIAYLKRATKITNKKNEFTYKIKNTPNFLSVNILW
jgi:hypothetical protein